MTPALVGPGSISRRVRASAERGRVQGPGRAEADLGLKTRTNHQSDWLRVGRAFARVHLALTRLGMTCQPNSQVLQEYPEMTMLQAEFNELLAVRAPEKVQMAVRVGRAERAYVALRRDPQDFLIDGPPSAP